MIIVNTPFVDGKKTIKSFGVVRGNTVRARHIGKDIIAAFKNMVGGEIEEYTKLLAESRDQSIDRMCLQAKQLGANAIVNCRFSTSSIMQSAAEILVYGTAVLVEDKKE
ncbi:MAG: YbjQ family protein [Ignavibacteria bacterium]|nr:YbjQ family protein [Ignavibacteria bacterium]